MHYPPSSTDIKDGYLWIIGARQMVFSNLVNYEW